MVEPILKKGISLFLVILTILIVRSQASQTNEDERRFERIKNYWEWSSYFGVDGVDFPAGRYQEGKTFRAVVFFDSLPSAVYWGFCSKELGICQAYFGHEDGTIFKATGIRVSENETDESALKRFQDWGFSDRPSPSPHTGYDIHDLHEIVSLPKLELPEAVIHKTRNTKLEQAVREQLYTPSAPCTITVPFAGEHIFEVPILTECSTRSDINFASRSESGTFSFSHGGYVEGSWGKSIVTRLAPRIRANASLVLKPN
jgi:hypothetical protein